MGEMLMYAVQHVFKDKTTKLICLCPDSLDAIAIKDYYEGDGSTIIILPVSFVSYSMDKETMVKLL